MLSLAHTVQADSAKMINPSNGHSYQRIDLDVDWASARDNCVVRGAHLATLTSQEESDWVWSYLGISNVFIWLGATGQPPGVWQWITGEQWIYSNWGTGQPDNVYQFYLAFYDAQPGYWDNLDYSQNGVPSYICEWEPSEYNDLTSIADINKDGIQDQAALSQSAGNYYLQTFDTATGKRLKQVLLGSAKNITAKALTSVGKQISVLITKSTGESILQLRNGTDLSLLKILTLPK